MFVERALAYVLGYLLWTEGAKSGESDTMKDSLCRAHEEGRALAIKLRADNDFYSQTSQARKWDGTEYANWNTLNAPGFDISREGTTPETTARPGSG